MLVGMEKVFQRLIAQREQSYRAFYLLLNGNNHTAWKTQRWRVQYHVFYQERCEQTLES